MGREDGDLVSEFLQSDRGINDQSFCPTNSKVRMKIDDSSRFVSGSLRGFGRHLHALV